MKEGQAVTITVKIYFERKIQRVKEFHQFGNEIPLILHGSINEIWTVALLYVMSLLIVRDTTSETETFLKNVK